MTITTTGSSDEDAARVMFDRIMAKIHTSAPGIITGIRETDSGRIEVKVVHAIRQIITIDGERVDSAIPDIDYVPVLIDGSSSLDLHITTPIQVGDECWLHFAERSLDDWQEFGGVQSPCEPIQSRCHDLTDAVCEIKTGSRAAPIENYDLDAIEIRNGDGTISVTVKDDFLQLRNGAESITMLGDGNITIIGQVNIIGSVDITGAMVFSGAGTITGVGDVVTDTSISLEAHRSSDTNSGTGISGSPVV